MVRLLALLVLAFSLDSVASEICGTTGRQCVQRRATCVAGKCECNLPKYVWGEGDFACYRQNQVAAEVRNDPFLTTFNNETVDFHYPCRYMMTHVRQRLKDRNRNVIGYCEFQVFGFNKKHRGKIYVHGFDAAIKLEYDNGDMEKFSLRNYGTAQSGPIFEGIRGSYFPHGPWGFQNVDFDDLDNGISIRNFYDEDNAQMVFEAKQCGLRVTFVGYDIVLRRQAPHIPGLSVAVNCAHRPVWLSRDVVMGLPPAWQGGQLLREIIYPWLTTPQSVVVRAFESEVPQVQPDAANECTTGQSKIAACNDFTRAQAMTSCFWMLHQSRFMRCVDSEHSITNLLTLFTECVRTFCQPLQDAMTCGDVVNAVRALGCGNVPRIPVLTDFMDNKLCPPSP